jgi:hypothetical protein
MARTSAWTAVATFAVVPFAVVPSLVLSPTSSAQPTDPAFRPCDWVTTAEASDILGKPVTPKPSDDQAGSNDPRCFYAVTGDDAGLGISSELLLPGASPVDGATRLANAAAEPGAETVVGLGANAECVFEPQVTPPSTTILVLLDGGRIYRSTAAYAYCDTVERFARAAIARIPT